MNDLRNVTIQNSPLPRRAINALAKEGRYKTLADVEKASDEELLNSRRLGWKSLVQTRQAIEQLKTGGPSVEEWARNHRNLILALINGEAEIVIK